MFTEGVPVVVFLMLVTDSAFRFEVGRLKMMHFTSSQVEKHFE